MGDHRCADKESVSSQTLEIGRPAHTFVILDLVGSEATGECRGSIPERRRKWPDGRVKDKTCQEHCGCAVTTIGVHGMIMPWTMTR